MPIAPPGGQAAPGGSRRRLVGLLLALCSAGCGYIVGNPYPASIRTVHVPTFTNSTFRRGYELQLTEAVQKQIQLRTPFRLVGANEADTRLIGHIKTLDKNLTNQNRYDDPRELELRYTVEVRWENARTGELLGQQQIPISSSLATVIATSSFTPETGQSLATATQQAHDQLARQIVQLMEMTW